MAARTFALAAILAAAVNAAPTAPAAPDTLRLTRPVLLLGEVHDNALQHADRLRAFEALLANGARPVLALEQLDRDRQGAIDTLRRSAPPLQPQADATAARAAADAVIAAGGPPGAGWNWDFYRPFITLALRHDLPIVAANVSRDEARRVLREGLSATGFAAAVPADILAAQAAAIEGSHCGMLDAPTARRMALAQVARDQFMARTLEAHAAQGVVLLAGNGHVRTDIGVPRWLSPGTRERSESIGWLESRTAGDSADAATEAAGRTEAAAFDRVRFTPAQARPDPCAGMRAAPSPAPSPAPLKPPRP